ncbi:MAG: pyridoxal phosphate-dependent decarboxylase family protein [Pseudobdellovibrionaceae bacterium]
MNQKNIMDEVSCQAEESALKSLFLGPQAENRGWVITQIGSLLNSWFDWRMKFRPEDGQAIAVKDMMTPEYIKRKNHTEEVLRELAARFENEIPKFSPRYVGHMFSEISLPALFGHILTLLHNPNNISEESSKVGILIEEEAIEALCQMVGFKNGLGHFTSGGTLANFEAVYRAHTRGNLWMSAGLMQGQKSAFSSSLMGWEKYDGISESLKQSALELNPLEGNPFVVADKIHKRTGKPFLGSVLLVPEHKHYSWVKAANVFGLGAEAIWPVQLDAHGHLDVDDLDKKIKRAEQEDRPVLMVVSVLGTTELGMVDPIHKVQNLLDRYREEKGWFLWHHIDAAYGGFLCSLREENKCVGTVLSESSEKAIEAAHRATSMTIDPHKLGYVPFSSGTFIAADKKDYFLKAFGGPYVNFSVRRDKGLFTLEGSRSAAGAVATWMTSRCVGLDSNGYGQIIARTIRLRKEFEEKLKNEVPMLRIAPSVDANLLGFCFAKEGDSLKDVNERTLRVFETFSSQENGEFFVSKTKLYSKNYSKYFDQLIGTWNGKHDAEELVLFRLCIMNPFFKTVEMKVDIPSLFVKALQQRLS